nr:MAG TPA: hypothetical protein [Caudoviricetes sp.]
MDAVEFLKTKRRMCRAYLKGSCLGCKLHSVKKVCGSWFLENPEEAVAFVEQWGKDHPIKTRQSVFLKQYPEAEINDYGVLRICPCLISISHRTARGGCAHTDSDCIDCRREFWMKEVA